jgi:hypothetical protein
MRRTRSGIAQAGVTADQGVAGAAGIVAGAAGIVAGAASGTA